jgi:DoxX-like family
MTPISRKRIWTGRIIAGLAILFMLMDGIMKLFKPAFVVEATVRLGYPESEIVGIGCVLIVCTLLYMIPRTSILGAILLTGYLGGAVASNVRAQQVLFNVIFPVLVGVLIWGSLWLREKRVQNLLPFTKSELENYKR